MIGAKKVIKVIVVRYFNMDAEDILAVVCSVVALGCFFFSYDLDISDSSKTIQSILDDIKRQNAIDPRENINVPEQVDPSLDALIRYYGASNLSNPHMRALMNICLITFRAIRKTYNSLEPLLSDMVRDLQHCQNLDTIRVGLLLLIALHISLLLIKYHPVYYPLIKKAFVYVYSYLKGLLG
jgi:hypothetical protein